MIEPIDIWTCRLDALESLDESRSRSLSSGFVPVVDGLGSIFSNF